MRQLCRRCAGMNAAPGAGGEPTPRGRVGVCRNATSWLATGVCRSYDGHARCVGTACAFVPPAEMPLFIQLAEVRSRIGFRCRVSAGRTWAAVGCVYVAIASEV